MILALALAAATAKPMSYAEFKAVPQPPASRTISYGADPLQHVELWRPPGKGPFPVVLMLHGGCWQTDVAKADIMHAAAADLMKRGIAVWNVEYRGVDVPGGGYPGTFRDAAAAADLLGREGARLGLRTDRIVAIGHSAGGHLALWLAHRPAIARSSALFAARPVPIAAVVSAGGLPDLAQARTEAAEACGADTIDKLVGPPTPAHPKVYADTSPVALAASPVPATLVSGALDPIAPPRYAASYAAKARAKGETATAETVPGQGHFELILPGSPAWAAQVRAIEAYLQPRPR